MKEFEYLKSEYKKLIYRNISGIITGREVFELIYAIHSQSIFSQLGMPCNANTHFALKQAITLDLSWAMATLALRMTK